MRRSYETKKPKLYRFMDYIDQLTKIMFQEKACHVLGTTIKSLSDHLGAILYRKEYQREIEEYENRFVIPYKC